MPRPIIQPGRRRALHHRLTQRVEPPAASPSGGLAPRDILLFAVWIGLASGLLELGVIHVQDLLDPKVTVEDIRTNQHYPWMVPLSTLALVLLPGLAAAAAVRLRAGGVWSRHVPAALVGTGLIGPLLAVRGLHAGACALLAGGASVQLGPILRDRRAFAARLARWTLPVLAAIVAGLGLSRGGLVFRGEAAALAGLPPAPPAAPNVLFIVLDNVRADHLSLYGYHRPTSPFLERLARRGIRFDHARAPAPWTLPSHASMLTGRWPHELSCNADHPLDQAHPTLAEFLAGHGYATAGFVGNTYYCNAWYGLDRGFARYEDFYQNTEVSLREIARASALGSVLAEAVGIPIETPGGSRSRKTAAMINRDALQWIDSHRDRPFLVFLNYYDAHEPFNPPEGYPRRFGLSALDRSQRAFIQKRLRRVGQLQARDPAQAERALQEGAELLRDSFDDCIAYLDSQLERLFDELERRGILDKTLVVVTSDHGEHFGERGLFTHGNSLYRPLLDVPLVIVLPGQRAAGRVVDVPVSLRALPATIAGCLGLEAQSPFPGPSLGPLWQSEGGFGTHRAAEHRPLSEVEHQRKVPPSPHIPASLGPLWAVVAGGKTYIRRADGREELYDFHADPFEANNLAGIPEAETDLTRGRQALDRLLGPAGDTAAKHAPAGTEND
jgi:arylsulfatase A-like enzyme